MATLTKTARHAARTPEVKARWLGHFSQLALENGYALLEVESPTGTAAYWVRRLRDRGEAVGYRLRHEDTGRVYDVDTTFGGLPYAGCDCPAATWNRGPGYVCKHVGALRVALAEEH